MKVQVREKCWECGGTGKMHEREEICLRCDGKGYDEEWMEIGELAHEMERAKIVWEDEQKRYRNW